MIAHDTYKLLQGFQALSLQAKAHVQFKVMVGICELYGRRLAN